MFRFLLELFSEIYSWFLEYFYSYNILDIFEIQPLEPVKVDLYEAAYSNLKLSGWLNRHDYSDIGIQNCCADRNQSGFNMDVSIPQSDTIWVRANSAPFDYFENTMSMPVTHGFTSGFKHLQQQMWCEKVPDYEKINLIAEKNVRLKIMRGFLHEKNKVFKGKLVDQFDVTIKEEERLTDECDVAIKRLRGLDALKNIQKESRILKKLRNTEHVLNYLFNFKEQETFFLVMENFVSSLADFKFSKDFCTCRKIVYQVTDALEFLHGQGIVHLDVKEENIAVVEASRFKCKLMNFTSAKMFQKGEKYLIKRDIESLGTFISSFYSSWIGDFYDQMLLKDLFVRTQSEIYFQTIVNVKKHPYFFTPRATLEFIVRFCRKMEGNSLLTNSLNEETENIITNDWRSQLASSRNGEILLKELVKIYKPRLLDSNIDLNRCPLPNTCDRLVKSIRNLTVHHRNEKCQEALNTTDDDSFLRFWSDQFPQLIVHIYSVNEKSKQINQPDLF